MDTYSSAEKAMYAQNFYRKHYKVTKIFKWLKSNNISDNEMLRTFNCGVGFCIIIDKKNLEKIKKFFPAKYQPYVIGYVSKGFKQVNLLNKIKW